MKARLPLLALALSLLACGPADRFTGVWRSDQDVVVEGGPVRGYVELIAGQFGEDVAGIVRFYESRFFKVARQGCPCLYVMDGDVSGGDLTFVLDLDDCPKLGGAVGGKVTVSAEPDGDSRLVGTIFDASGVHELQKMVLFRTKDEVDSVPEDKLDCRPAEESGP